MEKVEIMVEGMSCQHCVDSVKKALEAVGGLESVTVSLENKSAVVVGEFSKEDLVIAIEKIGFKAS